MNLEINLVKVASVDAKMSKLLARNRVLVQSDTEALDSIAKFIADNASTFTAVITDQRLVAQLQDLSKLTIVDLDCLRYVLSTKGLDLWYFYVADVESNPSDIPEGLIEYNILDSSNMMSAFIPFGTKVSKSQQDNKLTDLYTKVMEMYGLFNGGIFNGMRNPIKATVESMKSSEELLGMVPTMQTTYLNSIFDFLKKDIRVITN